MTFIDFFAGVGGFRRGMELAGHTCVGFCEFDKFAVASYTSMHLITEEQRAFLSTLDCRQRQKEILKEEYRNGEWYANDVRRIFAGDIPKADCWCFGFPCQDISVAGAQLGFSGRRSSLFFTVTGLIKDLEEKDRPAYLFIENVKNLLSVNRGFDFARLLIELDEIGYDAEWQVINSKDYVPQNRERVFIIGHFRGRSERRVFPIEGTDGENSVSVTGQKAAFFNPYDDGTCRTIKSQYANNGAQNFSRQDGYGATGVTIPVLTPERINKRQNGRRFKNNGDPMFTLTDQDRHGVGIRPVCLNPKGGRNGIEGLQPSIKDRVYSTDSIACALATSDFFNSNYAIKIKEATKQGYAKAYIGDSVNFDMPNSKTRRGRVGKGIANTLDTGCNQGVVTEVKGKQAKTDNGIYVELSPGCIVYAIWYEKENCYIAIRKLTPKECFRLQGWTDDYFAKAEFVNSNRQLYKQAGNGVTVPVIYAIAKNM